MPGEDIIYFGDTGRVPYGTRGRETVIKYVRQDIRFLRSFDIKFIIIACGTASSAALPHIIQDYGIGMAGVVEPAAGEAVLKTKNGRIGVLGTAGTIASGKYPETISAISPDIEVVQKACPLFVPLVENGYTDGEAARIIAAEYLESIKAYGVDTIILGCTHYPLLSGIIYDIMGDKINLIDSGACAAKRALDTLKEKDMLSGRAEKGEQKYFVSDSIQNFSDIGSMFMGHRIKGNVKKIDIEEY